MKPSQKLMINIEVEWLARLLESERSAAVEEYKRAQKRTTRKARGRR